MTTAEKATTIFTNLYKSWEHESPEKPHDQELKLREWQAPALEQQCMLWKRRWKKNNKGCDWEKKTE